MNTIWEKLVFPIVCHDR